VSTGTSSAATGFVDMGLPSDKGASENSLLIVAPRDRTDN
jgi:hypothetical protein